jgi:phosphoenolpyruvate carboxykinase (ATP)
MSEYGKKAEGASLESIGIHHTGATFWNLTPADLIEETILLGQGTLTDTGALAIDTGEFTGRSPKDKFIVQDEKTQNTVWWGDVNIPFAPEKFDALFNRMKAYMVNRDLYIRDAYACADPKYRIGVRVVTEFPWSNLFVNNMFIRPSAQELENFTPDWHVICVPDFRAEADVDGTRQHNFAVINFTKKMILIGGTGYTGEIKKGIFTVLNYVLPVEEKVLSMHCSANLGKDGDTAVFFGLSGTGKTTLSSDPNRNLIGDDEHGWSETGVFNFEGGCYAKTIDLSREKEPQIFDAIRFGALLENIGFNDGTSTVNYADGSRTENTRVSYPIHHIANAVEPSVGGVPKNVFFLTCDAYGVLPPISRLTTEQAMYQFISGYTAKVAGTEMGVTEPQATFSACFGKAFLPIHPAQYAELLGRKLKESGARVWLVNTGWSGGSFGVGSRMSLKYTRALITAALSGELDNAEYTTIPVFNLSVPVSCTDVPSEMLVPRNTWADQAAYDATLAKLAELFVKNFAQYESGTPADILAAAPRAAVNA